MADDQQIPIPSDEEEYQNSAPQADGTGLSDDEDLPAVNSAMDEDDDDDDVAPRRRGRPEAAANDDIDDDDDQAGPNGDVEDLFGDDDDEPAPKRTMDDADLDSGDDEDRDDRIAEDSAPELTTVEQQTVTMDVKLPRQPVPEPSDGEMYLLKMPSFMSIEPKIWDYKNFQAPATDHHSKKAPSETFSAYNTALTTIRWRRSPNEHSELQSNARINRWSDGSLTLQLASDPSTQYEIDGNPLAPPQRNPIKPTPVSRGGQKGGSDKYDQSKDAFTYLVAPMPEEEALRVTNKITAGLSIKQSEQVTDDAIERLQNSLAKAANATKVNGASGLDLQQVTEDPDMGRKRAEAAEREKERARKRREAAEEKSASRASRVMGKHGMPSSRYGGGGLTIGGLEDDELGTTVGKNRGGAGKGRKPRQRRNSEYSDEEENGRRAFRADVEEYEVDDFVAEDDDEEEVFDDDEDPDDGIVEESRHRQRSPKRPAADVEDDEDAEGEPDDEVSAPKAKRMRKIVDEDDDDE